MPTQDLFKNSIAALQYHVPHCDTYDLKRKVDNGHYAQNVFQFVVEQFELIKINVQSNENKNN